MPGQKRTTSTTTTTTVQIILVLPFLRPALNDSQIQMFDTNDTLSITTFSATASLPLIMHLPVQRKINHAKY